MAAGGAVCVIPTTVDEAVRSLAAEPQTVVVAGGTDLMPLITSGRIRPRRILALRRVEDMRQARSEGEQLIVGAGVTYGELCGATFTARAPVLAAAARAVGSLQVRNLGTVGGALITAAPTGDLLPVLLVAEAMVLCTGTGGTREIPVTEVLSGEATPGLTANEPGRVALPPGELVTAVRLRRPGGPGCFLRVARRGAVARAGLTLALAVDPSRREVRCAAGGLTSFPVRFPRVEAWLADRVEWEPAEDPGGSARVHDGTCAEFGLLVADHALARGAEAAWRPPGADDEEIAYLHRALSVAARRALRRVVR